MAIKLLHLHLYFELALGCHSSIVYSIVRCHVPHHLVPCYYTLEWSGLADQLKQLSSPEHKLTCIIEILTPYTHPKRVGPNDLELSISLTYEIAPCNYHDDQLLRIIFTKYPGGFWGIKQNTDYLTRRKIHLLNDVTTDLVNLIKTYMTIAEFLSLIHI